MNDRIVLTRDVKIRRKKISNFFHPKIKQNITKKNDLVNILDKLRQIKISLSRNLSYSEYQKKNIALNLGGSHLGNL